MKPEISPVYDVRSQKMDVDGITVNIHSIWTYAKYDICKTKIHQSFVKYFFCQGNKLYMLANLVL